MFFQRVNRDGEQEISRQNLLKRLKEYNISRRQADRILTEFENELQVTKHYAKKGPGKGPAEVFYTWIGAKEKPEKLIQMHEEWSWATKVLPDAYFYTLKMGTLTKSEEDVQRLIQRDRKRFRTVLNQLEIPVFTKDEELHDDMRQSFENVLIAQFSMLMCPEVISLSEAEEDLLFSILIRLVNSFLRSAMEETKKKDKKGIEAAKFLFILLLRRSFGVGVGFAGLDEEELQLFLEKLIE